MARENNREVSPRNSARMPVDAAAQDGLEREWKPAPAKGKRGPRQDDSSVLPVEIRAMSLGAFAGFGKAGIGERVRNWQWVRGKGGGTRQQPAPMVPPLAGSP